MLDDGRVLLVADGMGGHRGGERASQIAVAAAESLRVADAVDEAALRASLRAVFARANESLLQASLDEPLLAGLGTTLTLAVHLGDRVHFGHVGDSRLYLWRAGTCAQLTDDHTQAGEMVAHGVLSEAAAARSRHRNYLTRYLGTTTPLEPQLGHVDLRSGDRLLLCSDGFYGEFGPTELAPLLGAAADAPGLARALIDAARSRRQRDQDNMTALVALVDD